LRINILDLQNQKKWLDLRNVKRFNASRIGDDTSKRRLRIWNASFIAQDSTGNLTL